MASELREQTVVNYLRTHPHFLENYVTGPNISKETFQRWATRRGAKIRSDSRKTITGPWLSEDLSNRSALIARHCGNTASFMFELACSCAQFVHTEQFDVYLYKDDTSFLLAQEDDVVMLKKPSKIRRAPAHTQKLTDCSGTGASIVSDGNDGELNDSRPQQRKLNTFLLDDIVSMDTVIMKVMAGFQSVRFRQNFAQKLTNADRASLFLVDQKTNELYARIFDVGMGDEEHVKINEDGRKEIRRVMHPNFFTSI
ncbi:unnamed protein product [Toxocara canis]|uniref:HTH_48 domain-containing protein n=1 Tax=Toxocara canis TaxID=6265 RepID=A0A183VB71_TOXCA|nr:unnamed protein product [Toxocara canis]